MKIDSSTYDRPSLVKTDLLVVILDSQTKFHDLSGSPLLDETVRSVERDFNEKRLKREYFTSLDSNSPARNIVVYSSTLSPSYNVWENLKIFVSRAIRVAKDHGFKRVSVLLNTDEAAHFVGKAVEGAILGGYSFSGAATRACSVSCRCGRTCSSRSRSACAIAYCCWEATREVARFRDDAIQILGG